MAGELLQSDDRSNLGCGNHYMEILELFGKEDARSRLEELKKLVSSDVEAVITSGRLLKENTDVKLLFSEIYLNKLELLNLLAAFFRLNYP